MSRHRAATVREECATCRGPVPYRPPSKRLTRPVPYCSVACYRQRFAIHPPQQPLIAVVRAFLAEGLPMMHGAAGPACAFCGVGLSVLVHAPTTGHAEWCRWARLRDRVAGEA